MEQVSDMRNLDRCDLRQSKKSDGIDFRFFPPGCHRRDLHNLEALCEDQGRPHHGREQLAKAKDQHKCDEVLMKKIISRYF